MQEAEPPIPKSILVSEMKAGIFTLAEMKTCPGTILSTDTEFSVPNMQWQQNM